VHIKSLHIIIITLEVTQKERTSKIHVNQKLSFKSRQN